MRNHQTKNKLLILGLFASLGLSTSWFNKAPNYAELASTSTKPFEDLVNKIKDSENISIINKNNTVTLQDEPAKTKTINVRGGKVTIEVQKVFYNGKFNPSPVVTARPQSNSALDLYNDLISQNVTASTSSSPSVSNQLAQKSPDELNDLKKKFEKEIEERNKELSAASTTDERKTILKREIEERQAKIDAVVNYVKSAHIKYIVKVTKETEADAKTEAGECDTCKATLEDYTGEFLISSVGQDINKVLQAATDAVESQEKDIKKLIEERKKQIANWKECRVDQSGNKISGDEERFACFKNILELAKNEENPDLCDDERKCESLAKSTYASLRGLIRGNTDEQLDRIDDILEVFDVDVRNGDYESVNVSKDDPFRSIIASLVIKRYDLENRSEILDSATELSQAMNNFRRGDQMSVDNLLTTATDVHNDLDELLIENELIRLSQYAKESDISSFNDFLKLKSGVNGAYCISDKVLQDPTISSSDSWFSFKVSRYDARCSGNNITIDKVLTDLGQTSGTAPLNSNSNNVRTQFGETIQNNPRANVDPNRGSNNTQVQSIDPRNNRGVVTDPRTGQVIDRRTSVDPRLNRTGNQLVDPTGRYQPLNTQNGRNPYDPYNRTQAYDRTNPTNQIGVCDRMTDPYCDYNNNLRTGGINNPNGRQMVRRPF